MEAEMNGIILFSNVALSSDVIDKASTEAIRTVVSSLPEDKTTYETVEYTLRNALDLMKKQKFEI